MASATHHPLRRVARVDGEQRHAERRVLLHAHELAARHLLRAPRRGRPPSCTPSVRSAVDGLELPATCNDDIS